MSGKNDAASSGRALGAARPTVRTPRARLIVAPLRVAVWRLTRRPARMLVVAAGVALATAALVAVSSSSLVVRERTLRQALDAVPPRSRSFRADEFGLAFSASPGAATAARHALSLLTRRPPVEAVEFRPLRLRTHLVELTGVEQLSNWTRLRSGRMPRGCRPARCEVLEIGSAHLPRRLAIPGLAVTVVGRADLEVPAVLGDFAERSAATLLVSSDPRGLASVDALTSIFRTASWVIPLDPGEIHSWDVDRLLAREARAQALLEQVDPSFALTAPDAALADGTRQGDVASRRLLLVGGELAALLLGFAVLAAVGLRRTLLAEWRRLEERGARRSQLWLFLTAETGAAALGGAIVGVLVGGAVAARVATDAGVGLAALLRHGVSTPTTLALAAVLWAAATLVLALSVRATTGVRAGPVRIGDVVAVAALAVALVAASRGIADSQSLAGGGRSDTLLLLFPGLVSLAAAILAARLLGPLARLAERGARSTGPGVRLALVALARAPAGTSVAVAFVVVSVGLAILAASYRTTLDRGIADEAAYQVPLDYAVSQGAGPAGPLDVASLAGYRSLAPGIEAYPVLRRFGDVPSVGTSFASPLLLGLEPGALRTVHGWRQDFGRLRPTELAGLLGADRPVRLAGPLVPRGTTGFGLAVRRTGVEVELTVVLSTPSGEIVRVPLSAAEATGAGVRPSVPPRSRIVALELSLTPAAAAAIAHREAEGSTGGARPLGSLELGPLVAFAGSRRLGLATSFARWVGRSGVRRVPGGGTRLRFALVGGQTALFRPREPTDGRPLPLVVSPDVARSAAGGLVTIQNGDQDLSGRVVAVAIRFPGTADGGGSFAIADESHLQTALDASAPGTGRPLEVWLAVPSGSASRVATALRRSPFSSLAVVSRRGVERELRSSPSSRSIELALVAGAVVALALAAFGLWLTLLGDVADERGELYDLEAQGVTPGELRGQLRLRIAILGALGLVGGVALGLVLARGVVRLLQVSATGTTPVPPLVRQLGWGPTASLLVVSALLAALLVEATVRKAFRETVPTPPGGAE